MLTTRSIQVYNNFGRRARSQFIGSTVCGMPRNRISQMEKIALTFCLFGFWVPYPVWVLSNVEYYKNPHGNSE